MSEREELIKLNKKLDQIIDHLKENKHIGVEQTKIYITELINEYRKVDEDIRHIHSKHYNKILFQLINHIIKKVHPSLLSDLDESTKSYIAAETVHLQEIA